MSNTLRNSSKTYNPDIDPDDYDTVIKFLTAYDGNTATFESYRRELERLLQWCCLIAKKSILKLTREDIESYIQFCLKPPSNWNSKKQVARFIDNNEGLRIPNPKWRPFIVRTSKQDFRMGKIAKTSDYQMSQSGIRALFAVLGSFYDHLLLEEKVERNPIALIRQKSRYLQKQQQKQIIRLSEKQWQSCLNVAREMADGNPNHHERTLFIITAMYLMYLRISEIVSTPRWTPMMNHFYRDSNEQ